MKKEAILEKKRRFDDFSLFNVTKQYGGFEFSSFSPCASVWGVSVSPPVYLLTTHLYTIIISSTVQSIRKLLLYSRSQSSL